MGFDLVRRDNSVDNRVIDKIFEACEEALLAGWTAEKFIAEFEQSWTQAVDDEARRKKDFLEKLYHARTGR